MCSLGKTLLAFSLLHFALQGQTCPLVQVSLDFLLLHSSSLWWKGHLFLVLVLEGPGVFIQPFNFSFFGISGWGIDLDYHDSGCFALEMNWDYSVISEIVPKSSAFRTLLLTMRATPYLLRVRHNWATKQQTLMVLLTSLEWRPSAPPPQRHVSVRAQRFPQVTHWSVMPLPAWLARACKAQFPQSQGRAPMNRCSRVNRLPSPRSMCCLSFVGKHCLQPFLCNWKKKSTQPERWGLCFIRGRYWELSPRRQPLR